MVLALMLDGRSRPEMQQYGFRQASAATAMSAPLRERSVLQHSRVEDGQVATPLFLRTSVAGS
jgi:hypothetical protein